MAMCKNLADHLNAIRLERKLSITEFSEELGIARSSLQLLLSGAGNPRADTVEFLADPLGTSPLWLLSSPQDAGKPAEAMTPQQLNQLLDLLEQLKEVLGDYYEHTDL